MSRFPSHKWAAVALVLSGYLGLSSCTDDGSRREARPPVQLPDDPVRLAETVRGEFQHAWEAYETHAWGYDELRPLSRHGHNWHREPLLVTQVDGLDALILLGFDGDAAKTQAYVLDHLSFDHDMYVQVFEINIRLLGGLLSAYQLTGHEGLLSLAADLGQRLLPAFDSRTGMPYRRVNLRTGEVRGRRTNPAEIGTLILEFGTLSKLTGDPVYYDRAKRAIVALYERRSDTDLVGSEIDVESGRWRDETCHIGGRIDSYLEYLWKGWLLFGDEDLRSMWATHVAAFRKHVVMEEAGSLWCGRVDMHSGAVVARSYGALEAFFPGLLALSGDVDRARRLQESSHAMWTLHGLEPEGLDFQRMSVPRGQEAYHLRPEIIESAYHLFRATGDPRYREMGRTYLRDIMRSCRVDAGYAAVRDVRSMRLLDAMPSYFLSETLKYLYLLYSEEAATVIEDAVLTTEGHPLWKTW